MLSICQVLVYVLAELSMQEGMTCCAVLCPLTSTITITTRIRLVSLHQSLSLLLLLLLLL
jgi:hypothetical protein